MTVLDEATDVAEYRSTVWQQRPHRPLTRGRNRSMPSKFVWFPTLASPSCSLSTFASFCRCRTSKYSPLVLKIYQHSRISSTTRSRNSIATPWLLYRGVLDMRFTPTLTSQSPSNWLSVLSVESYAADFRSLATIKLCNGPSHFLQGATRSTNSN
ncbi:hypothetical protein BKA81DRAFT_382885 [Phyllosticta paracitricarpa]